MSEGDLLAVWFLNIPNQLIIPDYWAFNKALILLSIIDDVVDLSPFFCLDDVTMAHKCQSGQYSLRKSKVYRKVCFGYLSSVTGSPKILLAGCLSVIPIPEIMACDTLLWSSSQYFSSPKFFVPKRLQYFWGQRINGLHLKVIMCPHLRMASKYWLKRSIQRWLNT